MTAKPLCLLGIDAGTTHCKAALFNLQGGLLHLASRMTRTRFSPGGSAYFDPDELWESVADAVREALSSPAGAQARVAAVGVASMAETGLLVERQSSQPRTPLLPWFDASAARQAAFLREQGEPAELFRRTGLRLSFKCSLAKLLWLRDEGTPLVAGLVWLSAADYIVWRLTGQATTDYSLAGRTGAFRMDTRTWDAERLADLNIPLSIFPPARPAGEAPGGVLPGPAKALGLPVGVPAAVCGHDHVCGMFAVNALQPGQAFDSMGTAESLLGALPRRDLDEADFRSGLAFGCHTARERMYWLGGLSASGGSVEWLRRILGEPALSYAELEGLLADSGPRPTGLLYFPYLVGSGAPHSSQEMRGAFIGLEASHGRSTLARAVLEGTAYEVEYMRRVGERAVGLPLQEITSAGGGTRNRAWMQIKADVSGCRIRALEMPESTLLGAALLAGVGAGVFPGEAEALRLVGDLPGELYTPDPQRHAAYLRLFEEGFLALQEPLRHYFRNQFTLES